VSIGVAGYVPGDSEVTLIGRADAALYGAKAEGRDRVVAAAEPATGLA
jgi:PleD family two-component response regulator